MSSVWHRPAVWTNAVFLILLTVTPSIAFQYQWTGPFKMVPKETSGKATVRRTLSFYNLAVRCLRILVWYLVHKYLLCRIDAISYIVSPTRNVMSNTASLMDYVRFFFCVIIFCGKFNVYYVMFYNLSRLVGDIQQFLLSPAFSHNTLDSVSGDEEAEKAWKRASFMERWARVEVEEDCLMPEGPCCILAAFSSSDIWRYSSPVHSLALAFAWLYMVLFSAF